MGETHHQADEGHEANGQRRLEVQGQPRSWMQPFLLLALEQWQSHGYELIRRLSGFGFEALDRGSVYRTLRQLEKSGLVVSGWDTSKDGPARRLYSLTDAGRDYLNVCAVSMRGYQMMLNQFFSLYPAPPGTGEDEAGGVRKADSENGSSENAKRGAA